MASQLDARPRVAGRLGERALWVAFVIVMAVAGAGMVLTLDHPQDDAGRPELTAQGDALVGARLAALAPQLVRVSAEIDAVSEQARALYGHLRSRDTTAVRADVTAGDTLVQLTTGDLEPINAGREGLLDGTTIDGINHANQAQVASIRAAADAAGQLDTTWSSIATSATRVAALVDLFARHDAAVVDATAKARGADYLHAYRSLFDATSAMVDARSIADAADRANLDTSTLRDLTVRNFTYDAALQTLYLTLANNGGLMTAEAQQQYDAVLQAQAALPNNGSAMTVIVSDLGGQQVTLGLIALDQLRGAVSAAAPEPVSSPSPG